MSIRTATSFGRGFTAALAAAVAVSATAPAAAQVRAARVPWDSRTHGGAKFVPDRDTMWVLSGTLVGANVWRIDPRATAPRRTPLPNMFDVFAGDDTLWGVRDAAPGGSRLSWIDVRRGYALNEKRLPNGCRGALTGHVVFRGRLWFKCGLGGRYAVFAPRQRAAVRRVRLDGELVRAADGLWVLDLRHVLRCVEGPCKGRAFPVGATGAWHSAGEAAWRFRPVGRQARGLLELVVFRARAVLPFYAAVPSAVRSSPTLRVVGDELWLQGARRFAVARYRTNRPDAPPRLLRLPGVSAAAKSVWPIEVAGGYGWLSLEDRGVHKLFRIAVPRDPPPLRRMRTRLAGELAARPRSFGLSPAAGRPLHVSCERREPGRGRAVPQPFRAALVFRCVVRLRTRTRSYCAAIVGDRLLVDRTFAACRPRAG